jgi:helix-turn-helix protein
MLQKLIPSDEAASILGISESMLNKVRGTGTGPHFVKVGARVLYDPRDLEKFIAAKRQRSTAENGGA